MQLKQISPDGHTSYLVYSTDTKYKEDIKKHTRMDSNYYSTVKYRRKETDVFDAQFYKNTFGHNLIKK